VAILNKLGHFLDEHRVGYTHHAHPIAYTAREVAAVEHMPPREVAKTVVYYGDTGFGMTVLPANALVDLMELRQALGMTHLRLATEKELSELFPDSELGAMPPFGNLYGLPVYVDSHLAGQETIAFNAGTHRDVIHMKFKDFQDLVKPAVIHFAREVPA